MSYRIYPVIPVEPFCNDYTVFVNGQAVELNTARVSAMPFNRRWPGHQRSMDQSEVIQFLSMTSDEPLYFEIRPSFPFDASHLRIRPRSLGISPQVSPDGVIRFTLPRAAYLTVEPLGRNRALHLFVDPICDYGVSREDDNVIYFGAGEHDVGMIELKSGQTLFLDEGAVVYACVRAKDAEHIRIMGNGILDNSRNRERILFEVNAENNSEAVDNARRTHTLQLEYCNDVVIDGITIRDSLVYNIRPIACRDLTVRHVKIIGCWRYNSDGIDMHNCEGVLIERCFIRTFDDSICVKGFDFYYEVTDEEEAFREAAYHNGGVYESFRNAVISDCVIWNDWGKALEIGAETRAEEICDICFRNCDVIHLTGRALDCMNVDFADVHDILFTDINIEADETIPKRMLQTTDEQAYENTDPNYMPPTISVEVCHHHEYSGKGTRRGRNRKMTFRNIRLYGKRAPIISVKGYDETHRSEDIRIVDLYHNDQPIESEAQTEWSIGDFVSNVRIERSLSCERKKNSIRYFAIGHSYLLHGPFPGWQTSGAWGMAASEPECDYFHRLKAMMRQAYGRDVETVAENFATYERLCTTDATRQTYESSSDYAKMVDILERFRPNLVTVMIGGGNTIAKDDASMTLFHDVLYGMLAEHCGKDTTVVCTCIRSWLVPICRHISEKYGFLMVDLSFLHEKKGYENPYYAFSQYPEYDREAAAGAVEFRTHPGDFGHEQIARVLMETIDTDLPCRLAAEDCVAYEVPTFERAAEMKTEFRLATVPPMQLSFQGFHVRQVEDCVVFGSAPDTGASISATALSLPVFPKCFYLEAAVEGIQTETEWSLTLSTTQGEWHASLPLRDCEMHRYEFDLAQLQGEILGFRIKPIIADCLIKARAIGFC